MGGDIKLKYIAHLISYLLNAGVAELHDGSAILADEVIVLFVFVCFFKQRDIFSEMMLYHQVAVEQKFNGIVNGGSAHAVFFAKHFFVERFNVKMPCAGIDLIENGIALSRFPMLVFFKIIGEDLPYVFFYSRHEAKIGNVCAYHPCVLSWQEGSNDPANFHRFPVLAEEVRLPMAGGEYRSC